MNAARSQRRLRYLSFGCLDFQAAAELQIKMHGQVLAGAVPETVLWGEHPPTLTAGKHADHERDVLNWPELRAQGFELYPTDRGGELTVHDRGQLVVYPILRIGERGLGVRKYVEHLEAVMIATLAHWGISGERSEQYPGVWVGTEKIGALGIRISQRVSRHGMSLNVCNSLKPYELLVPCGIKDKGVTSMARILKNSSGPDVANVAEKLIENFRLIFEAPNQVRS